MLKNLNVIIQWKEPPNSISLRKIHRLDNIGNLIKSFLVYFIAFVVFFILIQIKTILEGTHIFGFIGALLFSIFLSSLIIVIILFIYKNSSKRIIFYEGMIQPNIFEYWRYCDIILSKVVRIKFKNQEYNIIQMFSKDKLLGSLILDNNIDINEIIQIFKRKDVSIEIPS